jgi:hypothetical protein
MQGNSNPTVLPKFVGEDWRIGGLEDWRIGELEWGSDGVIEWGEGLEWGRMVHPSKFRAIRED